MTNKPKGPREMSVDEREFLLAEYHAAWDMILKIDERRGAFARYCTILFGGAFSVVSAILASQPLPSSEALIGLGAILATTAVAGCVIIFILWSERKANVRYRKRINKIREIFLAVSPDQKIGEYFKSEAHSPGGIGQTLPGIFLLIALQIAVAIAGIWFVFKTSGEHDPAEKPAHTGMGLIEGP